MFDVIIRCYKRTGKIGADNFNRNLSRQSSLLAQIRISKLTVMEAFYQPRFNLMEPQFP